MNVRNHIDRYFEEMTRIIREIDRKKIGRVVDLLFEVWRENRAVYVMGNGGSASAASHFVCDLAKCTIVKGKRRFKVIGLVDNIPLVSAWTNDSGFGSIFEEQLEPWLQEGDAILALSVHGGAGAGEAGPWSQNLVRAMRLARKRGAKIIGFSGFDGGAMRELADVCVIVPLNTEPLGTPLVETFHTALHHLICTALKARIEEQGT